jgi:hypothetical protein
MEEKKRRRRELASLSISTHDSVARAMMTVSINGSPSSEPVTAMMAGRDSIKTWQLQDSIVRSYFRTGIDFIGQSDNDLSAIAGSRIGGRTLHWTHKQLRVFWRIEWRSARLEERRSGGGGGAGKISRRPI